MRNVLLVSLNFPPSTIASVHRARHLAKHLPTFGWRPTVLAVDEAYHKEPPDPGLGALVPDHVDVVRIGAIPVAVGMRVGVGDLALRSLFPLTKAIDRLVAERQPDVVFLTGWPFYEMLLARRLKRRGLKVVLDFQDPWVSAAGAARPALSKGGLSHRLATLLEPRAVAHADAITSVSDEQNRQMRDRYPFLANVPMEAIPIGGDPDDFDALRAAPPAAPIHPLDPAQLNFCYVGTFMPRSGPLMAALLSAAGRLAARRPDLAARLTLNFVGTSNQPDASGEGPATRLARELGVAHLVAETPRRVPFLEALSLLANADGLMLVGSDEPHYTASKIYPNLMAARPFVSLFHAASSAHAILTAAGGGRAFAFEDPAELGALTEPLSGALEAVADQGSGFSAPDPAAYAPFTAEAVAGRYAALFERLAG